ncbi:NADH-quinone oxidoreductase subunit M [Deinococcus detaillensis]|uniref:NADH-quinone oxidoreductase subunit M n=1 Tax=Deinococcus detaillensis TaxID=2592048 RepID=A0A553UZ66_9DEIO|nr:NADH-quinone oxidoreductase subunit M [Deinococcus detaillensis]TSA85513.1 NADH-quinone oxidoreductase subunit M [Deinococcus detaillensis]
MLNLIIFLPLLTGLLILALPASRPALLRWASLGGAGLTLLGSLWLWFSFDGRAGGIQSRTVTNWVPSIGASYDVGLSGLGLAIIVLTALLLTLVMVYVLSERERVKEHAFLFLLMGTGLIGLFSAQDLLLFYLFFEVALVPMYFIVGIWGGEGRRYAAMKFFLYTRAGSLAMLLSFLALYLGTPGTGGAAHSFSIAAVAAAQPYAGTTAAFWVMLGLLLGFGVKLPTFPLHNWLPDAHVEAPTEGSVMLAGAQLKMGAYGLLFILLPLMPQTVQRYAWLLAALGIISLVYGALAALAQRDLKRLIAYTSINHMGYVMLAAGIWGLTSNLAVRELTLNGAAFQMVSHGLLTGGMFFLVGILGHRAGTRNIDAFGGLMSLPRFAGLLGLLAFGSLGLPGLSGFVAEFQVIGATVGVNIWLAVLTVLGLLISTGLYLRVLAGVLMGQKPAELNIQDLNGRELWAIVPLAVLSLLLGILPAVLLEPLSNAVRSLAALGR